jgi:L-2,4-diaminobutyric acid acetyltransferase
VGPILRRPRAEDGPAVTRLIAECPPLDANSAYCNLLQCTHFAATCILAEWDGDPAGWISAYRPPDAPHELFVWQVAVHEAARGQGLGGRMLDALIDRPACRDVTMLTTTVTEPNAASLAMFTAFARRHGAPIARHPLFERAVHFAGAHDTEYLVSIGPLPDRPQPSGPHPSGKEEP